MTKRATRHLRYRDVRPVRVAESLSTLCGPCHGEIKLPSHIYWHLPMTFNLDSDLWRRRVYEMVITEGTQEDFDALLDQQQLIELWPTLTLAPDVVAAWESKFSELKAA